MREKQSVFFRNTFEVEAPDFWWAMNREELQIESPSDYALEMHVRPDDDALPRSISRWITVVVWTQVLAVSADSHEVISKLRAGPSFNEAMQRSLLNTPIPDAAHILSYAWIPKNFYGEMQEVHSLMDRSAFKALSNLFWKAGAHCGPSKLQSDVDLLEYSLDGENFDSLPFRWDLRASPYQAPPPRPLPPNFEQPLCNMDEAPLHHALFKEAWQCRESEDRVSVVMAAAAVETAVKHLISKLLPDTKWLLENIPSPPVDKMLRELIQQLPAKCGFNGKALRPPDHMITKIKRLLEFRNKIVHGSSVEFPSDQELELHLIAARDFLWLADYYCGHEWALAYISKEVVTELQHKG